MEASGDAGEALSVEITVRYPWHTLVWADRVTAGDDGIARIRVPYATLEPNGDGRVVAATWRFGDREGPLPISTAAVFGVGVVRVAGQGVMR